MPEPFDPYANESRYTLDYLCYLAACPRPASVRLVTPDPEVAKALVRRLAPLGARLAVETPEIAAAVGADLAVEVGVGRAGAHEVVLCPWLDGAPPPDAVTLVGSMRNAWSYRSLRYPTVLRSAAPRELGRLGRRYRIRSAAGYFPPGCVALLALAAAARRWHPSYGYFLNDLAMRAAITTGRAWRLSYVVLFRADAR